MAQAAPVTLVGQDGSTIASPTNPLPVAIDTAVVVTAIISSTIALAASTASIGSATIIGSLPAGTNPLGKFNYNATTAQLTSGIINFSALGTAVIVTGVASTTIKVYRMLLTNGTATNLTFQSNSAALTGALSLAASQQIKLDLDGEPWFVTNTADNFDIQISATSQISGRIYYLQS